MNTTNTNRAGQQQGDSSNRPTPPAGSSRPGAAPGDAALEQIGQALEGLRYGSVLVIVQDGVVIQIERTEKTRLGKADR
jgi:hypothetical protein